MDQSHRSQTIIGSFSSEISSLEPLESLNNRIQEIRRLNELLIELISNGGSFRQYIALTEAYLCIVAKPTAVSFNVQNQHGSEFGTLCSHNENQT
jgi:hypothetical protein